MLCDVNHTVSSIQARQRKQLVHYHTKHHSYKFSSNPKSLVYNILDMDALAAAVGCISLVESIICLAEALRSSIVEHNIGAVERFHLEIVIRQLKSFKHDKGVSDGGIKLFECLQSKDREKSGAVMEIRHHSFASDEGRRQPLHACNDLDEGERVFGETELFHLRELCDAKIRGYALDPEKKQSCVLIVDQTGDRMRARNTTRWHPRRFLVRRPMTAVRLTRLFGSVFLLFPVCMVVMSNYAMTQDLFAGGNSWAQSVLQVSLSPTRSRGKRNAC